MKKLLLLITLLFSSASFAGSIEYDWTAPTERTDNSTLPPGEIGGFKIYYNTDGTTAYPNVVDIPDPAAITFIITGLLPATYNAVITVYDTAGRESLFSTVLISVVDFAGPKPVTGATATVLP